ncbi:RnfABCDGE type electron transport complex subunit B [uncultured Sphaerochaeta sp.]|uniref:RnfABCDGE type electron transport complex subunit B n=1 Tax=uncultured Sphaerochaeta sp. TaxID=886478 RepID=UPI002A0A4631|nr:RnfABCDGE type electron transport complex subunit B [uncultured Sphaerochaeta sp.]
MNIVMAIIVVAVLGGLFGFGLSYAEKKLAVKKDPKALALEPIMPGANCGVCGYAGCAAYAAAVALGEAPIGLCSPGGPDLVTKMAEIMGQKVEASGETRRKVAHVMCRGNVDVSSQDYKYEGLEDCNAAFLLFGGDYGCKSACLHLGSCIKVCPTGAISRDAEGYIIVDEKKCISCEKCVQICPTGAMHMIYEDSDYVIECNSHEPGGKVRKVCTVGCIGCKICENKYPESGCKVDRFLSTFDQTLPHSQIADAAEACPTKCIIKR